VVILFLFFRKRFVEKKRSGYHVYSSFELCCSISCFDKQARSRVHDLSNSKPDSDAAMGCVVVLVIIVLLRLHIRRK